MDKICIPFLYIDNTHLSSWSEDGIWYKLFRQLGYRKYKEELFLHYLGGIDEKRKN